MKDLKRILITRYTVFISIVLVAVSLIMILPLRSFTITQEKRRLEEEAQLFAREFQYFFEDKISSSVIDNHLESISRDTSLRITLINIDGVVLGDSEVLAREMENHANRFEVAAALDGRVESAVRDSRTIGKKFVYAAAPIRVDGKMMGVARVSMAEEDVMPVMIRIWNIFLLGFGALLFVIIIISVSTERTIVGDLRGIRDATSGLAAGDLTRRAPATEIEDFSDLARDFNVMAERIGKRVEELAEERGKLQTVLKNISAGIMVTDSEGKIIMFNPAAEAILGVEEKKAKGNRAIEIFSSRELDSVVSCAIAGGEVDEEVELFYPEKLFLHVKSSPVVDFEGKITAAVSVMEDITSLKQMNIIRQDFVANVSHELRTPVASVKALTDSLLMGAWEQKEVAKRFLHDLDREITRLSQIIEDLLTLSKLEAKGMVLKSEDILIGEFFNGCIEFNNKLAKKYKITLKLDLGNPKASLKGDSRLLKMALGNLIDNAIKYNRPGGEVVIDHRVEGDSDLIRVSDTGTGIPHEELSRIFERFYRIDKARSRKTGGTGLGLSIVKHVVELHDGRVGVRSVEGEGSIFTIYIPRRHYLT